MPGSSPYISLSEAAKASGYTSEYLRQLCVKGKLKGQKIGRSWVTTLESVNALKGAQQNFTSALAQSPEAGAFSYARVKRLTAVLATLVVFLPVIGSLIKFQDKLNYVKDEANQIVATTHDWANNKVKDYIATQLAQTQNSSGKVLGENTVNPKQTIAVNNSSVPKVLGVSISNSQVLDALRSALSSGLPSDLRSALQGPPGPQGPAGATQYIPNSGSVFGTTAPAASQNDFIGTIGSASSLSSEDFSTSTSHAIDTTTQTLTVTEQTTLSGSVTLGSGNSDSVSIGALGGLRFLAGDGSGYVGIQGPATIASSITWTLPNTDSAGCFESDGAGHMSIGACGGGGGTPGGADTQVQFNDGGAFGGDAGLIYNKTTHALTATGPISASNLSGTNTGDQTITLTGDVTGSGTGSFAASIANNAVTSAKILDGTIVNADLASGSFTNITTVGTLTSLSVTGSIGASNFSGSSSGTNSGDQTITLTGDVTGSGTGSFAATIANNAVTSAKILDGTVANADLANSSVTINTSAPLGGGGAVSLGNALTITCASCITAEADTLATVTGRGNSTATGIQLTENGNTSASYALYAKRNTDTSPVGFLIQAQNNAANTNLFTVDASGNVVANGTIAGSNLSGTNTGDQTITLTGDVTGSGTGSFAATIANNAVTSAKILDGTIVNADLASGSFTNITTVGTLTSLTVTGSIGASNFSGTSSGTNTGDQTITLTGDVTGSGTGSFAATIATGAVTSAKILDGTIVNADLASGSFTNITTVGTLTGLTVSSLGGSGTRCLQTDNSGVVSIATATCAAAAGSTKDIQFNSSGAFAADTGLFTYDSSVHTLFVNNIASQVGTALTVAATAPTGGTGGAAGVNLALNASNATIGSGAGTNAGGVVNITAGNAVGQTSGSGSGGAVNITGGSALYISGSTPTGGALNLTAGASSGSFGIGGAVAIAAGNSSNTGGAVTIDSGTGVSGGALTITGGHSTTSGGGGPGVTTLQSSAASANFASTGNVAIKVGDISNGSAPGNVGTLSLTGGSQLSTIGASGSSGGPITITTGSGQPSSEQFSNTGGNAGTLTVLGGTGGSANVFGNTGTTELGGTGGAMSFTAGPGGAVSGSASNTLNGGTGGSAIFAAGSGGSATGSTGTRNGGNGGDVTIASGTAGTGASANGADGNIIFKTAGSSGTERFRIANTGLSTFTGTSLNTDADLTVGITNFTNTITKNDSNTRTFPLVQIKPTLNTGASNTNTTVNLFSLDTTNTAVTGLTVNLLKASYGGTQKLLVDSSGNITDAALTSGGTQCLQATSAGLIQGLGSACPSVGGSSADVQCNISSALNACDTGVFTYASHILTVNTINSNANSALTVSALAPAGGTGGAAGNNLTLSASNATTGSGAGTNAGGAISITAGNAAGQTSGQAAGGAFTLTAGNATAFTSGLGANGGAMSLTAGNAASVGSGAGTGGALTITAGVGSGLGGAGGAAGLIGGSGYGGGAVSVTGGAATTSGNGGNVNITSGSGGPSASTGGNSGTVVIVSGASTGLGTVTGAVSLKSGDSGATTVNVGTVTIAAGVMVDMSSNSNANNSSGTLTVTSGKGQNSTNGAGNNGGNGAALTITAGAGGGAVGGGGVSGSGATVTLAGGKSGDNTGTAGTSIGSAGTAVVVGGAGGAQSGQVASTTYNGGAGGLASVTGGAGGAASGGAGSSTFNGGAGASAILVGGAGGAASGGSGTRTGGNGGDVVVASGAAGTGASANGTDGNIIFKTAGSSGTERFRIANTGLATFTGTTLNTNADLTVGITNFTNTITKNDSNTRTFPIVQILPTINAGGSNANTTLNLLSIDTVNTSVTGVTTNLIKASYGGSQKFLVSSSGKVTLTLDGTASTAAVCGSQGTGTSGDQTGILLEDCSGTPAADYSENYPAAADVADGDVVMPGSIDVVTTENDHVAQIVKADAAANKPVLGVISRASDLGDFNNIGFNIKPADNPKAVALNGRVLVKFSAENGPVAVGDRVTLSATIPGEAMKQIASGESIGVALEDSTMAVNGQVMIFLNLGYQQINVAQNSSGALVVDQNYDFQSHSLFNVTAISSANGLWSISADGTLTVAKVQTKQLCLDDVCINSDQLKAMMQNAGLLGQTNQPAAAPTTGGGSGAVAGSSTDNSTNTDSSTDSTTTTGDSTTPPDTTTTPTDSPAPSTSPQDSSSSPGTDSSVTVSSPEATVTQPATPDASSVAPTSDPAVTPATDSSVPAADSTPANP